MPGSNGPTQSAARNSTAVEHYNGSGATWQQLEFSGKRPKTSFTIADLFAVCSYNELEWFVREACGHFAERLESTEDREKPDAYYRALYLANIQMDRGKLEIFWPNMKIAATAELSLFIAGFTLLSLDDGANTTGKVRTKLTVRKAGTNIIAGLYKLFKGTKNSERLEFSFLNISDVISLKNDLGLAITADGVKRRGEKTDLFLSPSDPLYISTIEELRPIASVLPMGKVATRSPKLLRSYDELSSTLVIPSAGRSSRFPGHKPKWLLTMPNGRLMVVDAIAKLNLASVHRIVVGVLKEHVDKYCGSDVSTLIRAFEDSPSEVADIELTIVVIESETIDQVQTIESILKSAEVTGPIFLKDCDNQFACDIPGIDGVATLEITKDMQSLNVPAGKSYVDVGMDGKIDNIVEKAILGNTFCVGGYSFQSAEDFLELVSSARNTQKESLTETHELAVSDIIWSKMIDQLEPSMKSYFNTIPVHGYEDWGTVQAWEAYCGTFRTLFLDVDGTLIKNSGAYFKPNWGMQPSLSRSVAHIKALYDRGRTQIILTTSRPESFRDITEKQLREAGVPYDHIVFGMFHAQRVLVNDYARTNPFPSASAINLKRDSDELPEMLGTY